MQGFLGSLGFVRMHPQSVCLQLKVFMVLPDAFVVLALQAFLWIFAHMQIKNAL